LISDVFKMTIITAFLLHIHIPSFVSDKYHVHKKLLNYILYLVADEKIIILRFDKCFM